MEPFITKYAKITQQEEDGSKCFTSYDVHLESNTMAAGSNLAIDSREFLLETTGSYMTRAQTDPTKDEHTDREVIP